MLHVTSIVIVYINIIIGYVYIIIEHFDIIIIIDLILSSYIILNYYIIAITWGPFWAFNIYAIKYNIS